MHTLDSKITLTALANAKTKQKDGENTRIDPSRCIELISESARYLTNACSPHHLNYCGDLERASVRAVVNLSNAKAPKWLFRPQPSQTHCNYQWFITIALQDTHIRVLLQDVFFIGTFVSSLCVLMETQYTNDSKGREVNVTTWCLLVVAIIAGIARLGSKYRVFHRLTIDDFFIVGSLVRVLGLDDGMTINKSRPLPLPGLLLYPYRSRRAMGNIGTMYQIIILTW